jgi:hypothetical protein
VKMKRSLGISTLLGKLFATGLLIVLAGCHSGSPVHRDLNSQWTTVAAPIQTRLGFRPDGTERITEWVTPRGHSRPRPEPLDGHYKINGGTLVQIGPPHRTAFRGMGLNVVAAPEGDTVVSEFKLSGNDLILSQKESGKSVTLRWSGPVPPRQPGAAHH